VLSKKPPYYQTRETPAIGLVHPSRGILFRFPRFICSLLDKNPRECSKVADLVEMFHSHTRKMDVQIED